MTPNRIDNRDDFSLMLALTASEIDGLATREPAYPVWGDLQRQLHAMLDWTANGAEPTLEQQQRISIGLIAARELEPPADSAMGDLIDRLHVLSYHWRRLIPVPPPAPTKRPRIRNPILLVSVFLFVAACCLPTLEFKNSNGPNDVMFGLRALAVGWSGIFAAVFAWYANPFWLLGLILLSLRKPVLGAVAGGIAIAIASSTFGVVGMELPGDEGNVTKTAIIRLLPGCYIWMASLVVLPLAAIFSNSRS